MATGGTLKYYIDADTTGLRSGLTQAEGLFGRFGKTGTSALRGLVAAAAPLATVMGAGAIGAGLVASVRNASDLTEQVSKTGVVFRGAAREVEAFSNTTANALGVSKRSALEAAGTFGNMLVPMGVARAKAADMSVAMVKLAADLASFNNADPSEVLEAMRSGLAGETEPMRRFGVFLSDAAMKSEAMAMGIYKGTGNLTAQQKALATYSLYLKQTTDAQGDVARTQDTLANGTRRFKAQMEDTSAAIGTAFLPPLTKALAVVNREVMPGMQRAATDIGRIWESPELDPAQKWEKSWARLDETGIPDLAKQAVYDGLVEVGTHGPRILLTAMAEAPWPAKAILGGVLVAKFAPALGLLGGAVGKALGTGGGAAGGIAGGRGGVVPVFVTNAGGIPSGGGPAGAGGAGAGGLGFGGMRGFGGPLTVAGAAVVGGMAFNSFAQAGGLEGTPLARMFPSDRENREATSRFYDSMIRAYRGGMPRWRAFLQSEEGTLYRFQGIDRQVNEAMGNFTRALNANGGKVKRSAQAVSQAAVTGLRDLQPGARAVAADAMIRMTSQLELSGRAPKGTTRRLVGDMVREFGRLPDSTRQAAAAAIGWLNGIGTALSGLGGRIGTISGRFRSLAQQINAAPTLPPSWRFARGGEVPGPLGAGDVIPAWLSPGEVVLTREMVRDLGPGAVFATVAARGGRRGGTHFARGGVATAAYQRAVDQLGEPYGKPSRGKSRTGPNSWDCSGYATFVAGVAVGGNTEAAYKASSPARSGDDYAILWGFRKSHSGAYRGGYDEHMGVRVNGRWFDAGSGGVQSNADSQRWSELRVPRGLERLRAGGDGDGPTQGTGTRPDRPARTIGRDLRTIGRMSIGGASVTGDARLSVNGRPVAVTGSRVAADYRGGVADVSAGIATDPDSGAEDTVRRGAQADARAAGKSPEDVVKAGDDAVNAWRERFYTDQIAACDRELQALKTRANSLRDDLSILRKQRGGTTAQRNARLRVIRRLTKRLQQVLAEIKDVQAVRALLVDAVSDLRDDIAQENYENQWNSSHGGGGDSTPTPEEAFSTDALREVARRDAATANAGVAWLGAVGGATDIDPATGAVVVNVNVGGSLVQQSDLARFVVEALGGQGYRPRTSFQMA